MPEGVALFVQDADDFDRSVRNDCVEYEVMSGSAPAIGMADPRQVLPRQRMLRYQLDHVHDFIDISFCLLGRPDASGIFADIVQVDLSRSTYPDINHVLARTFLSMP